MAVKIRLRRMGMKKAPYYRVVVADSRSPRDGRFIESIGIYHPTEEPSRVEIDADKARAWLAKGAQPSEAVINLLAIVGVKEPAEARKAAKARRAGAAKSPSKAAGKPSSKAATKAATKAAASG